MAILLALLSLAVVQPLSSAQVGPPSDLAMLCKRCRCDYDPGTWMVPENATIEPPDSDSLLVNCSRTSTSPFAGAFEWPDVPLHHEEPPEEDPTVPWRPASRADFSWCNLAGGVRPLPIVKARRLRELSLSQNLFSWLEVDAFKGLPSLKLLDLSGNKLAAIRAEAFPLSSDVAFASNLEDVRLSHNMLLAVPWEAMLRLPELERLDLGHNSIKSLDDDYKLVPSDATFNSLKVLNLTSNKLTVLKSTVMAKFTELLELDLSWNNLETVPEVFLSTVKPLNNRTVGLRSLNRTVTPFGLVNLRSLILDGNPIKVLGKNSFAGVPSLTSLSLSSMGTLVDVDPDVLSGLWFLEKLRLSRNPQLSHLPELMFQAMRKSERWTLKKVDLSYNSLETLKEDTLPWEEIDFLDLQGNPWICNCSLQWMLDDWMPVIYKKDSGYLFDLRCAKPNWLRGRRFVHWLNRSEGIFCGKRSAALIQEVSIKRSK
ncbi:hypothetical protein J437_LFUL007725 [Ladona fulva]|uniref:LRRCT domain-containing protein n=1 Tax=Ladona fulva TaxID=123851 RepID=A0A8K0NYP2_LADFU|nr:hypothetical protein J437_LFUL007725 [Ladona fulva]